MPADWLGRLARRAAALLQRSRREQDLDEEVRFHIEMEERRHVAQGLGSVEARRRARVEFGGIERVKEECREARGTRLVEDLLRDLRHGARTLRRVPTFAIAALVGLALGVGGPAAIFGAVRGLLLKPLAYADADRLVFAFQHDRQAGNEREEVAPANFLDWRERSRSFETLAALEPHGLDWLRESGPVYLPTWLATEGFFDQLGVRPLAGRTFLPEEHQAGRGDAVLLGFGAWQRWFGADPAVVGRTLTLDGRPYEVVGVMPEGFALPSNEAVWAPKVQQGWEPQARGSVFYTVVGRLRDGVTLGQAQAELDLVARQLSAQHPATNAHRGVRLVPLADHIRGRLRGMMKLLLAAVVLVFLIACSNLANLQLARALKRTQEFALRGALGAGTSRLVRQLVTESLLLAGAGCALGFFLAHGALEAARRLAPEDLPSLPELRADVWVVVFSVGTALLAATLTGLLPIRIAAHADVRTGLSAKGRSTTAGRGLRRTRDALVVAQVALSMVLLVGAGLLLRSFVALLGEDRGFRTERVAVLTVQTWGYVEPAARVPFVDQALARIAQLPGVQSVAVASSIPIAESIAAERALFTVAGQPLPGGAEPSAIATIVTPDYFRTLGVPLRSGRLLDAGDRADAPAVVVINETLARRFFPASADPTGQSISLSFLRQTIERTVVGVVGDVRRQGLDQVPAPAVYVPFAQSPTGANAFFILSDGDLGTLRTAAKDVIWSLHPTMPVARETTLEAVVSDSVRERRFVLVLLGLFAGLALALAALGIFGVVSYAAAERTHEMGIRRACGAREGHVAGLIVRHGGVLAAAGIAFGLAGSALLTRLLAGMLYGVRPLDVPTFAGAAAALLAAALLASWAPAAQSARVDPVAALRVE